MLVGRNQVCHKHKLGSSAALQKAWSQLTDAVPGVVPGAVPAPAPPPCVQCLSAPAEAGQPPDATGRRHRRHRQRTLALVQCHCQACAHVCSDADVLPLGRMSRVWSSVGVGGGDVGQSVSAGLGVVGYM